MQPNNFCLSLKIDVEFKQVSKASCIVWYTFLQFLSVLQIFLFVRFRLLNEKALQRNSTFSCPN